MREQTITVSTDSQNFYDPETSLNGSSSFNVFSTSCFADRTQEEQTRTKVCRKKKISGKTKENRFYFFLLLLENLEQFLVKAKFHYGSLFGTGSEHVRSWLVPNSITLAGSEPAPNQLA